MDENKIKLTTYLNPGITVLFFLHQVILAEQILKFGPYYMLSSCLNYNPNKSYIA